MDGVDAALVSIEDERTTLLGYREASYSEETRRALEKAVTTSQATLGELSELHVRVGQEFAAAALKLLSDCDLGADDISAIGSHGQTIWHDPAGRFPATLQVGDGSTIAVRTGIPTVTDFRSADIALGGQGAPLVPPFHASLFTGSAEAVAIVNIGGIANVTLLPAGAGAGIRAFDTGPGNTLLDLWITRQLGRELDVNGDWARTGRLISSLLRDLQAEAYFERPPPKSTGRELFNAKWLDRHLERQPTQQKGADVQCTLVELTAATVSTAVKRYQPETARVLVCGGGARNSFLMERLRAHLCRQSVDTTDAAGVPGTALEAMAFAWLAHRRMQGLPGNLVAVTGAKRPAVLGALYMP